MDGINLWAVFVAAASAFMLGGLWYSPALFLKPWLRHSGMGDKPKEEAKHPARVFGVSFLFSLISAAAFAYLLGAEPPLGEALGHGALVGFACPTALPLGRRSPERGRLLRHQLPVRGSPCRPLAGGRRLSPGAVPDLRAHPRTLALSGPTGAEA